VSAGEFAERTLEQCSIAVCVGCGGVGKTTIAAALGVEAARRGRRALVLTIDPARRLADALGIGSLGNQPQPIPDATLAQLEIPDGARLSAMMLDMKRTFDDLVERFADSPETRDRILGNAIYQHASDALAGSIEYSAMEKVFELHEKREFDLIVVDTPPAQHALDFLEAPQRLIEFLDSRLVQVLIHPAFAAGRFGFRLFHRSTQRVLQLMERVSGMSFLEDISEFLLAFEGMSRGFRERARRVRALLTGPEAAFVLVAGPGAESQRHAIEFLDRLEASQVPLAGVLVNRVHPWPGGGAPPECIAQEGDGEAELAAALGAGQEADFPARAAARAAVAAATGYAELVRRDARSTRSLRERTEARERHWGQIPEFAGDIHDLVGLAQIANSIFRNPPVIANGPEVRDTSEARNAPKAPPVADETKPSS
jgi:anion-transporting  ArsA/GET3 family ATPase